MRAGFIGWTLLDMVAPGQFGGAVRGQFGFSIGQERAQLGGIGGDVFGHAKGRVGVVQAFGQGLGQVVAGG
jgi:hypothetical protein